MAWDATTAYANEFAITDGVEDAVLTPMDAEATQEIEGQNVKVLRDSWNPDMDPQGGNVGLPREREGFVLWRGNEGAPAPLHGDKLTVDGQDFVIISVQETCRSVYALECSRYLENS